MQRTHAHPGEELKVQPPLVLSDEQVHAATVGQVGASAPVCVWRMHPSEEPQLNPDLLYLQAPFFMYRWNLASGAEPCSVCTLM